MNLDLGKHTRFSDDQVTAIRLGANLAHRHMYMSNNKMYNKYSMFSNNDIPYDMENKAFFEKLIEATYLKSGKSPEHLSFSEAMYMQDFSTTFFSVISQVVDVVNSKNDIEEILTFADVRNMAEGDGLNVIVKPTNAYFFYKTSRGRTHGIAQKYMSVNTILNPTPVSATISFSRADIIAGKVDWGKEISRLQRGMRSGMLQDVAGLIFNTMTNPIGNKIVYSTGIYNETDFRAKVQSLQALNGSSNTYIYGTNLAVAPILPTDTNLRLGLGVEYMDKGYIASPFGYKVIEIPQAVKADQKTFIIPNNYVVVMSADTDKPITIGMSGVSRVAQLQPEDNASNDFVYTITTDWDVKMTGQGRIMLYRMFENNI